MNLHYNPDASLEKRYTVIPESPARKAAIDAMNNWSDITELARFASDRHGYANSDSYFGTTYPSDLDDYDIANGENIPKCYIEVMAGCGVPNADTLLILETEYLELLRQYLKINDLLEMADEVAELRTRLKANSGV